MCCSEYTETHTCGKRDSFNSLILGGEETVPGEWPWAVILQFTDDDMRCGGVLISSRHVLTAAHCTDGLSPTSIGVTVGLTDLASSDDQTGAVVTVKEIINHPEYRSGLDLEEFEYNLQYLKRVRDKVCRRHLNLDIIRSR